MSKVKSNYEIISDKTQNPVTTTEYIKHGNDWLKDVINDTFDGGRYLITKHGYTENSDISTAISSVDKVIDLEGKTFKVSSAVTASCSGIVNGKIVVENIGNGILFSEKSGILISNLKVESSVNYASETKFKYYLMQFNKCKNIVVDNSEFTKSDFGLNVSDSERFIVCNSVFDSSKGGAFNISSDMNDNNTSGSKNGYIYNNVFSNGYEGFKGAYYLENVTVIGNEAFGNERDGFDVAGYRIVNVHLISNYSHNNGANGYEFKTIDSSGGADPKPTVTSEFYNNSIVNNTEIGNSNNSSGITTQNSFPTEKFAIEISGNTIRGGHKRGIKFYTPNSTDICIVKDNTIVTEAYNCYGISSVVSFAEVTGNNITLGNDGIGIYLEKQASTQEVGITKVYDNIIHGGRGKCIVSDENFNNSVIANNRCVNEGNRYPIESSSAKMGVNFYIDTVDSMSSGYPTNASGVQKRISKNMVIPASNPTEFGAEGLISSANWQINSGSGSALRENLKYYNKFTSAYES